MNSQFPKNQMFSAIAGIFVVAVIDVISPWALSGPGMEGALRAAFWYALIGCGGGMVVYEIIRRLKSFKREPKDSN